MLVHIRSTRWRTFSGIGRHPGEAVEYAVFRLIPKSSDCLSILSRTSFRRMQDFRFSLSKELVRFFFSQSRSNMNWPTFFSSSPMYVSFSRTFGSFFLGSSNAWEQPARNTRFHFGSIVGAILYLEATSERVYWFERSSSTAFVLKAAAYLFLWFPDIDSFGEKIWKWFNHTFLS